MRRTVRGRGARGFVSAPHAYEQRDAVWYIDNERDHAVVVVSTATCRCGKHDVRVCDLTMQWEPLVGLRRGERLEFMRPVDFRKCRELPPLLSMRGAPA